MDAASDQNKLDGLVEAMARYLSHTLCMRDPIFERDDVHWKRDAKAFNMNGKSTPTFVQTLHREFNYLATNRQLRFIESLREAEMDAKSADDLAALLIVFCEGIYWNEGDRCKSLPDEEDDVRAVNSNGAIALASFSTHHSYYNYRIIGSHGIVVGGFGRILKDRIQELAMDWLWQCDTVLRAAMNDHREPTDVDVITDDMVSAINKLSRDIAHRVALHDGRCIYQVDALSSASLEAQNAAQFVRTRPQAESAQRFDLHALEMLNVVLSDPTSPKATAILENDIHRIRMILAAPPTELGLVGENARRSNFAGLSRCFDADIEVEARPYMLREYLGSRGAWALTAIREAIRRIRSFSHTSTYFLKVATTTMPTLPVLPLHRHDLYRRHDSRTTMPLLPWAEWTPAYFAIRQNGPINRSGLDEEGQRVVRLRSFIWQLVADGVFEAGIVSHKVVNQIALEMMRAARLARDLINHERKRTNIGMRLWGFHLGINDPSNDMASVLDHAQCELRHFSYADLREAFRPDRPDAVHRYSMVAQRVRELLGNVRKPLIPVTYSDFVGNALSLLDPAIKMRRTVLHVPLEMAPNPIGELLRSVPRLKTWTPLQGTFTLTLNDLKQSHPDTRRALEELTMESKEPNDLSSGIVALHDKPHAKSNAKSHMKIGFELEPMRLLSLLKL